MNNKKIEFINIANKNGFKEITFAAYLKKDWVSHSLVITLNNENIIKKIYINSNKYGSVEWINGLGLKDFRFWETEDNAVTNTFISEKYVALLADGVANLEFAKEKIIPNVLNNFADQKLAKLLKKILCLKEYNTEFIYSRSTR